MQNFDNFVSTIMENYKTEILEYPQHKDSSGLIQQGSFDWRKFKVDAFYSDGDVYRYVLALHPEFDNEDRIDGVYKLVEMNPANIDESEWDVSEAKVSRYAALPGEYPPIVVDNLGCIVDGGHRHAAALERGDHAMKVFMQQ